MSSPGDDDLVQMEASPRGGPVSGRPGAVVRRRGCTAGCMRVAAVEEDQERRRRRGGKQIMVLYRYAAFSVSSDGVVARGSTEAHLLRVVAAGEHSAGSRAWAGAALARLIYPGRVSEQLQELWSGLAAQVSALPRAARVEVFVDVGILQRSVFVHDGILRMSEYTPERVERMRPSLERIAEEPWPVRFTGMELHLPEPMRRGHDKDEATVNDDDGTDAGERPAKRRRVVAAGEDCPVCLQLLEGDDLAAWPGCVKPHVFHGACLEGVLVESKTCPMCRHYAVHRAQTLDVINKCATSCSPENI
ncbi:hypothetical protein ZWY2020_008526 [Hordeum vulgare]|nr:hypothetical protein ZWY2020_008526 [Hordeum vulgare]